jgi:hypothetical protein
MADIMENNTDRNFMAGIVLAGGMDITMRTTEGTIAAVTAGAINITVLWGFNGGLYPVKKSSLNWKNT